MVRRRSKGRKSSRTLTGRDALGTIDGAIANARRALRSAMDSADQTAERRAEVRREQMQAYMALADMRLAQLKANDGEPLDAIDRRASDLLDKHQAFVAAEKQALDSMVEEITRLELERTATSDTLDEAIEAYEEKVAEVEAALRKDKAYRSLIEAAEKAASVAEHAEQKLGVAQADRDTKGEPYDSDPLFSYLWKRKFRTPDYEASAIGRTLDGWVARLCDYDKAHLNYRRLVELPQRLAEHVAKVNALESEAEKAVEAAEAAALEKGGAERLREESENTRKALEALDQKLEEAEAEHVARSRTHQDALQARTGPAEQARRILGEELRRIGFPDLRVLATQTVTLKDDQIVDQLVKLRAEEMSLDLEADKTAQMPARRRDELNELEELRAGFKRRGFGSAYVTVDAAIMDDTLSDIISGRLDADRGLDALARRVRRRQPKTHPGFGGARRRGTLGLPDHVAEDLMWEIGKGVLRGGMHGWGGGHRSGGHRTSKRTLPGPRKSGGFKTGGKF